MKLRSNYAGESEFTLQLKKNIDHILLTF